MHGLHACKIVIFLHLQAPMCMALHLRQDWQPLLLAQLHPMHAPKGLLPTPNFHATTFNPSFCTKPFLMTFVSRTITSPHKNLHAHPNKLAGTRHQALGPSATTLACSIATLQLRPSLCASPVLLMQTCTHTNALRQLLKQHHDISAHTRTFS